jgi:hypothetical protein
VGDWISRTPIWLLGLALFLAMVAAALAGDWLSRWADRMPDRWGRLTETQVGYVVTTVYALLGLLIGFTFSVAVERFQYRRELVVRDAVAIEQLYLRAQLLEEPHRSRFSNLLVRYAENHIALAQARRDQARTASLLSQDEAFQRDLWIATVPAFQSIRTIDFSSSFVDSVNEVINTDAERNAVRRAEIPRTIIHLLMLYSIIAAALLGAVMKSRKGEVVSIVLLALSTMALMLIADINRPVDGTIHESQEPMIRMLEQLRANPPPVYQKLAAQ